MKMKSRFLICALLGASCVTPASAQQLGSGETDGYRLVWQDLFDGTVLHAERWNIEVNGSGGGNNELQYYTDRPENVRVGDDGRGNGCLILTARRENYLGKAFTSGRVNTKNLFCFTHGKIEAAIRFPSTANGLWPAFWMMGNDYDAVGWPRCGETDIVEMGHQSAFGPGTQDRFFNGACHWGPSWPNASYAKDSTKAYSLQDGEFHLFTLVWDETSYRMYVDLDTHPRQTPYFTIDIPQDDKGNEWSAGNYFHKDNFILFNLAVGGNFPGIWDAAGITALNDGNGNEASMYVDYVKVYQKGLDSDSLFSIIPGDAQPTVGDVQNGVAETGAGECPAITVCGSTVCSEGAALTVSDISGKQLAGGEGCLSLCGLAAGIYIIEAVTPVGRSSLKILL